MKTVNHKAFRTSPLGGYAGVSSYERRKSGGLARFGKDAIAIDFERMQKRIHDNDAKRGSALVLRGKRFKLFLKCLEILGIGQRIANEDRDNTCHDSASETERSLRAAENIVHRRGRVSRFLLCHVRPVETGDGDGDSSAADHDAAPQAPNQPHVQRVEKCANESVRVWALDPAAPHSDSTTLAEYRGGKIVAFRRFNAENVDCARV